MADYAPPIRRRVEEPRGLQLVRLQQFFQLVGDRHALLQKRQIKLN
jgi:hypothetical protein